MFPTQQKGTALVETVIVLPFMLILLFGIAEMGRAFYQYNILTKAVRDGARYAAEHAPLGSFGSVILTSDLIEKTKNTVVYGIEENNSTPLLPGLSISNVSVARSSDYYVVVNANYNFVSIFGEGASLPTFGLGNDIPLSLNFQASVVMRGL